MTNTLVLQRHHKGAVQLYAQSIKREAQVDLWEGVSPDITSSHTHHQFSGVLCDVAGTEDQVLNDRLNATPFNAPLWGGQCFRDS